LAIELDAADVDSEVRLPLRDEVRAHGLVERVGVVRIGESFHLRPCRIPLLVLGLRRGGVELDVVVRAVAEVTVESLAHHTPRRLSARRALVADRVDQRFAVDRLAERVTTRPPFFRARERTRFEVETDPEGGA